MGCQDILRGFIGFFSIPVAGLRSYEVDVGGACKYGFCAGDTAFAGFAAGYLKKLPPETCAKIAVALAGEKLKVDGARLADPKAALQSAAPELAKLIA